MTKLLRDLLAERSCLLADGATGTNFFAMGLQTGDAPELWNRDYPERVAASYRSFIEAGSDILLSNSFGGNRYRLGLHNSEADVAELNERAVSIAREEVAKTQRTVLVAGCMGPTGEILAPVGDLSMEDARAAFAEQAHSLAQGGADVLWIETLSSLEEMQAALEGASEAGLPIVSTMSFDTNGRSMMGITPAGLARFVGETETPPIAYGANCGVGPSELVVTVANMVAASEEGAIIVAKGNCGIPEYVDGAIRYDGTPELMAAYACMAMDAGARIIGGCCGTTPEHVAVMRKAIDRHQMGSKPSLEEIVGVLGEVSTGATAQFGGDDSLLAGSASGAAPRRRRTSR